MLLSKIEGKTPRLLDVTTIPELVSEEPGLKPSQIIFIGNYSHASSDSSLCIFRFSEKLNKYYSFIYFTMSSVESQMKR